MSGKYIKNQSKIQSKIQSNIINIHLGYVQFKFELQNPTLLAKIQN